ncbi:MAG: AtzE family amidohydrolase, partial [Elioraea sp.]|nr:AtzE family amidohydrolase [Elioraea sp.]
MTADALLDRDAAAIAEAVRARTVPAVAVAEAALARIAARNPSLNAFTEVTADRGLAEARAVDQAIVRGEDPGPLAGVPFAVKNLFDIRGLATRAGSRIGRASPPAAQDATAIRRLRAAGAVLVGALNMGEYAYDFTGENAHDGPARNPHDPARMAGGSSGGSGAAVAARLVPLALGSDTNGSIRVPAAFCGVFGLKPTFGRLSRAGTEPFVASLDHIGPLARSVRDLALAYDAMQGWDAEDPACRRKAAEPVGDRLGLGAQGLRVACLDAAFGEGATAEAVAAVEASARALGVTRTIALPEIPRARAAAQIITAAEAGALHLDRLRTRALDYDPATRDRFLAGALLPAAWLLAAQRFRRWFFERTMETFRDVDVLLAPATPFPAPPLGAAGAIRLGDREVPLRAAIGL